LAPQTSPPETLFLLSRHAQGSLPLERGVQAGSSDHLTTLLPVKFFHGFPCFSGRVWRRTLNPLSVRLPFFVPVLPFSRPSLWGARSCSKEGGSLFFSTVQGLPSKSPLYFLSFPWPLFQSVGLFSFFRDLIFAHRWLSPLWIRRIFPFPHFPFCVFVPC